jgi:transcriptional regulator with XRE-family HTH domain
MAVTKTHDARRAIGTNIRAARERAGLSQAQASAAIGMSQTAWSRWEAGSQMPRADQLGLIAGSLGTTAHDLLGAGPM